MNLRVTAINRFPVKGMRAEPLDAVALVPGAPIPGDRQFAVTHARSRFNPDNPEWRPKSDFLVLARNEIMAGFDARFDPGTGILAIGRYGAQVVAGDPASPEGRHDIEAALSALLAEAAGGAPVRIAEVADTALTDTPEPWLSVLNTGTVGALEAIAGQPVDPARFRANIAIEGAAAWKEFVWVGQDFRIGGAVLRGRTRIDRCAATTVDPATGMRDINIPKLLQGAFGHIDFGIFAEVIEGGTVRPGDTVTPP